MGIRENLKTVQDAICRAAVKAGRDPAQIKLIAVSKTKPLSMVQEAVDCGMLEFGENRPQELAEKAMQLPNLRWHQIGQLQKNKVRHIIDKVALIHSVDTLSLAQEIEKRASAIGKIQDILVQVNVSGEETKSGVSCQDAKNLCQGISETCPHIRILGLMTISVRGMSEEENFAVFSRLKALAQEIETMHLARVSMRELSMGMTHDFEPAIRAGATMIRVGTGIFGARDTVK